MSDANDLLIFNGINGATGEYDLPPTPVEVIAGIARGETFDKQALEELRRRRQRDSEARFAVKEGVDPKNLDETGWGVIFAFGADPAIYEALTPLLELRKRQASAKREGLYREFRDADAYRPGESKLNFLNRHGVGPGPVDPEAIPYYLLIVGDPDTIPFRFQYQLDVQYAVGRIHFETAAEYAAYARSIVAAETGTLALAKRAAFFAVANDGDGATKLSHDELATPLAAWAADPKQNKHGWVVDSYFDEAATKARLASLLSDDAPAFLFTASHGMCYANGDVRQLAKQGALLCQDWPGPSFRGTLPDDFFYSGDDRCRRREDLRDDRDALCVLWRGDADAERLYRVGAAGYDCAAEFSGKAAAADAGASARRGAGGDRPCGAGVGLLVSLGPRGEPDGGVQEHDQAADGRASGRVGGWNISTAGMPSCRLTCRFNWKTRSLGRRSIPICWPGCGRRTTMLGDILWSATRRCGYSW